MAKSVAKKARVTKPEPEVEEEAPKEAPEVKAPRPVIDFSVDAKEWGRLLGGETIRTEFGYGNFSGEAEIKVIRTQENIISAGKDRGAK